MTINELNIIKSMLSSYQDILHAMSNTKQQIILCWHELRGVKSPSLSVVKAHGDPALIEEHKHDIRKKMDKYNRILAKQEAKIEYLDRYIDMLPDLEKELTYRCYINKEPIINMCKEYGYSKQAIYKKINKALLKLPYEEF